MKLLGIEMSLEEFNKLMCEQSQGKELVVEDGKVIAKERVLTEEQITYARLAEIEARMSALDQDFRQADLGAVFDDLKDRKAEFIALHNEWRILKGKEPRIYINKEVE